MNEKNCKHYFDMLKEVESYSYRTDAGFTENVPRKVYLYCKKCLKIEIKEL